MPKERFTIDDMEKLANGTRYIIAGLLFSMENSKAEDEKIEVGLPLWANVSDSLDREPWKNARHSGDCTKEAHTCNRCVFEEYLKRADALLDVATDTLLDRIRTASGV